MGFFDGGAKSLSFGNMGDNTWLNRLRGGEITDISDERLQTDWKTKAPNPQGKTQVVATLRCTGGGPLLRAAYNSDPAVKALIDQVGAPVDERTDPSDDGRRSSYIKGNLRWDIGNKLRELQVKAPLVGGELYIMFDGTRQTPNGPGRTHTILYFPPPAGSVAGGFYDQSAQQPPAAPAQQGNAYGFGHQPAASPGGQAFAAQQSGPPAFGGAPAQQPPAAMNQGAPAGDPWGAPSAPQGPAQPPQQGGPAASPWG
jgi:hypothetical protein